MKTKVSSPQGVYFVEIEGRTTFKNEQAIAVRSGVDGGYPQMVVMLDVLDAKKLFAAGLKECERLEKKAKPKISRKK